METPGAPGDPDTYCLESPLPAWDPWAGGLGSLLEYIFHWGGGWGGSHSHCHRAQTLAKLAGDPHPFKMEKEAGILIVERSRVILRRGGGEKAVAFVIAEGAGAEESAHVWLSPGQSASERQAAAQLPAEQPVSPQPSKGQEARASPHSQGSRAQKEGLSWASSGLAPTGPAEWGRNLVLLWNVPAFPEMPPFTPQLTHPSRKLCTPTPTCEPRLFHLRWSGSQYLDRNTNDPARKVDQMVPEGSEIHSGLF